MCFRGGRRYRLIVLLLHKTKDMELNTARLFFRTTSDRIKPFMRHILSLHSVSGCNTTSRIFMKGKTKFSESLKLTQNTGGQLLCFRTVLCLASGGGGGGGGLTQKCRTCMGWGVFSGPKTQK